MSRTDVLVLAHRGASAPAIPENTAAAVRAALSSGADGVEVDLRLSADGVLVACHDADLRRLSGRRLSVGSAPWRLLRSVPLPGGHRLARLPEVLDAAGTGPVVLELKTPLPGPRAGLRVALALSGELSSLCRAQRRDVTISSFDAQLLAEVRRTLHRRATWRTALLGRPLQPVDDVVRQALAGGHDEVHLHRTAVRHAARALHGAHEAGLGVTVWTVNNPSDLRRCRDLGVRAVITDRPGLARAVLAEGPVAAAG